MWPGWLGQSLTPTPAPHKPLSDSAKVGGGSPLLSVWGRVWLN